MVLVIISIKDKNIKHVDDVFDMFPLLHGTSSTNFHVDNHQRFSFLIVGMGVHHLLLPFNMKSIPSLSILIVFHSHYNCYPGFVVTEYQFYICISNISNLYAKYANSHRSIW